MHAAVYLKRMMYYIFFWIASVMVYCSSGPSKTGPELGAVQQA